MISGCFVFIFIIFYVFRANVQLKRRCDAIWNEKLNRFAWKMHFRFYCEEIWRQNPSFSIPRMPNSIKSDQKAPSGMRSLDSTPHSVGCPMELIAATPGDWPDRMLRHLTATKNKTAFKNTTESKIKWLFLVASSCRTVVLSTCVRTNRMPPI